MSINCLFSYDDKIVTMEVLNPMQNEVSLPQEVLEAYQLFVSDEIQFAKRVLSPLHPDVIYDVYTNSTSSKLVTHVSTDYPDPVHDSEELRRISGYSFKDIITPNAKDNTIAIVDNDELDGGFFVKIGNVYHYVANTEKVL